MNYYPHHIGDHKKSTSHFSILELGVYQVMLDRYYDTEAPLTADEATLFRLLRLCSDEEKAAGRHVLQDMFILTEAGWRQPKCDATIAAFKAKSAKSTGAANKRWEMQRRAEAEANQRMPLFDLPANAALSPDWVPLHDAYPANWDGQHTTAPSHEPCRTPDAAPRRPPDSGIAMPSHCQPDANAMPSPPVPPTLTVEQLGRAKPASINPASINPAAAMAAACPGHAANLQPENCPSAAEIRPAGGPVADPPCERIAKAIATNNQEPLTRNHKPGKASGERAIATRLPPDWQLSPADLQFCQTQRPDLEPFAVANLFRDYWIAQPGVAGRKTDWSATWRNWVRKERGTPSMRPNAPYQSAFDKRQAIADALTGRNHHATTPSLRDINPAPAQIRDRNRV